MPSPCRRRTAARDTRKSEPQPMYMPGRGREKNKKRTRRERSPDSSEPSCTRARPTDRSTDLASPLTKHRHRPTLHRATNQVRGGGGRSYATLHYKHDQRHSSRGLGGCLHSPTYSPLSPLELRLLARPCVLTYSRIRNVCWFWRTHILYTYITPGKHGTGRYLKNTGTTSNTQFC